MKITQRILAATVTLLILGLITTYWGWLVPSIMSSDAEAGGHAIGLGVFGTLCASLLIMIVVAILTDEGGAG